jgi:Mrp family chromosome partitioning ATPase
VVWLVNLALLWLVPAVFISVNYVLGTRVLAGDLAEMLLMSRQILAATLGPDGGALPTVLLALAVALAGQGVGAVAARRRDRQTLPDAGRYDAGH